MKIHQVTFRPAYPEEDERCARILHNAFLTAWEFNWWQSATRILPQLSLDIDDNNLVGVPVESLRRLEFYRAVIRFTRSIHGHVLVCTLERDNLPVAVLLWLPPRCRPTLKVLYQSGWIRSWWNLNVQARFHGLYRFLRFEMTLGRLYQQGLQTLGYAQKTSAFVQIIATDPSAQGHGYSSQLLGWQITNHYRDSFSSEIPVVLDTATERNQKLYEKLGFRLVTKEDFPVYVDEQGLQTRGSRDKQDHKAQEHALRIMILEGSKYRGDHTKIRRRGRFGFLELLSL